MSARGRAPGKRGIGGAGLAFAIAVLLQGLFGPGMAHAEHGMPWMLAGPVNGVLPPNGRVVLQSSNGVSWYVSALHRRSPDARAELRSHRETVALRVVDAFDDLEGGPRKAFASEAGYGESLLVLAPVRRLRPGDQYDFVLSHRPRASARAGARPAPAPWREHVLRRFTVSAAPDRVAPRWWIAPHLEYRPGEGGEGGRVDRGQPTLVASLRGEPGLVLLELAWRPLGRAPARRMVVAFDPAAGRARASREGGKGEQCREVALHGAAKPAGARYRVTLTAVDLAGHRGRAPGRPFVISWPAGGAVVVCLRRPAAAADVLR